MPWEPEFEGEWRPPFMRRRPLLSRLIFGSVWLLYLVTPVSAAMERHPSPAALALISGGLVLFVASYVTALMVDLPRPHTALGLAAVATMIVLTVIATLLLGGEWVAMFVYVTVAAAFVVPAQGVRVILAITALAVVLAALKGVPAGEIAGDVFPTLVAGLATLSFVRLVRTNLALRQAREEIARLVVSEERLRFARDLHDLLGHSLSLIALKSELAGRLLPAAPERAAAEVADVERVARQALAEVREAVSGYRRTTLAAELAGARVALDAADIRCTADGPEPGDLPPEVEDVLGWTVREGTTNVLRHSQARRCTVSFRRDDHSVAVEILDDGRGAGERRDNGSAGSGLAGLAERVTARGGRLEAGLRRDGGFRLRVELPLGPSEVGAAG
jgi:two-component system, NarL family, sensor histidine kinase DesK